MKPLSLRPLDRQISLLIGYKKQQDIPTSFEEYCVVVGFVFKVCSKNVVKAASLGMGNA